MVGMTPANRPSLHYGEPMRSLLPLVFLAACNGGVTPTDTAGPDPTGSVITPDPPSDQGSLTLVRGYANGQLVRSELVGLFGNDLQDYVNVGACVIDDLTPCLTVLPEAEGERRPYDLLDRYVETQTVYQYVGLTVPLGPYETYYQADDLLSWYYADLSDQPDFSGPADVSVGVEWGEHDLPDALEVPAPLVVLSPAQDETLRAFSDDTDFTITWEPEGAEEMYLFVQTTDETDPGTVFRVDDDGAYDLDLSSLGLIEDTVLDIQLARWSRTTADVDGNELTLMATSEVDFTVAYVPVGTRVPIEVGDTCADALPLPIGGHYGDLSELSNTFEVTECLQSLETSEGNDAVYTVEIPPRHRMQLELTQLEANGVLYVLETCDDLEPVCTEGADRGFGLQTESLTRFNASADTPEVLTVVVDSIFPTTGGLFFLDYVAVSIPEPDLAPTCEAAVNAPLLQPGQYYLGDASGMTDSLNPGFRGCTGIGEPGPDGTARVLIPAGSTLEVTVSMDGADPAIYLTEDCTELETCVLGNDTAGSIETLIWTNGSRDPRELYLTIDSQEELAAGFVTVTITP